MQKRTEEIAPQLTELKSTLDSEIAPRLAELKSKLYPEVAPVQKELKSNPKKVTFSALTQASSARQEAAL